MQNSPVALTIVIFVITIILSIIAYFLKTLRISIDERFNNLDSKLDSNSKSLSLLELKMSENYVTKSEFNSVIQKTYDSQKNIMDRIIDTFCDVHARKK